MLACQAKHEAAPVRSYDRENGQGEMHHEAGAHAARVNDFTVQCNTWDTKHGIRPRKTQGSIPFVLYAEEQKGNSRQREIGSKT